jgi:hypothetical protein
MSLLQEPEPLAQLGLAVASLLALVRAHLVLPRSCIVAAPSRRPSTTGSDVAVEPFVPRPTVLASIRGSTPAADTLRLNLGGQAVDLS